MTVLKRKNYDFPISAHQSNNGSSHSLIFSEISSETSNYFLYGRSSEEKEVTPCSISRRRARRYFNHQSLSSLRSQIEEYEMAFPEIHDSPLTKLMKNPKSLNFWNHFIALPEDEQDIYLKGVSEFRK